VPELVLQGQAEALGPAQRQELVQAQAWQPALEAVQRAATLVGLQLQLPAPLAVWPRLERGAIAESQRQHQHRGLQ